MQGGFRSQGPCQVDDGGGLENDVHGVVLDRFNHDVLVEMGMKIMVK